MDIGNTQKRRSACLIALLDLWHFLLLQGKIIWAKGFDKLLELQERYRESTGSYFSIDVYGGGEDVSSIKRAAFGRKNAEGGDAKIDEREEQEEAADEKAADVFSATGSLREIVQESQDGAPIEDEAKNEVGPVDVFADLSGKTLQSGAGMAGETANAALKVIESVVQHGIGAFSKKDRSEEKSTQASRKTHFSLAPARSRFKWRKTPLPARFLGVKDHIELRELPSQKIFLNMSTTEVLCT